MHENFYYQNAKSKLIIWSSMENIFITKAIECDVKRFKEISKLTTGQG